MLFGVCSFAFDNVIKINRKLRLNNGREHVSSDVAPLHSAGPRCIVNWWSNIAPEDKTGSRESQESVLQLGYFCFFFSISSSNLKQNSLNKEIDYRNNLELDCFTLAIITMELQVLSLLLLLELPSGGVDGLTCLGSTAANCTGIRVLSFWLIC